jgi:hypothetical protein
LRLALGVELLAQRVEGLFYLFGCLLDTAQIIALCGRFEFINLL